jgi:hypothetical protein
MIDADTAFRLGLVQRSANQPNCWTIIELATTINHGRLIAQHSIEFIEDRMSMSGAGKGL